MTRPVAVRIRPSHWRGPTSNPNMRSAITAISTTPAASATWTTDIGASASAATCRPQLSTAIAMPSANHREEYRAPAERNGWRTLADARDLLRFRAALEPACVAAAIENAPDAVLKRLDQFRSFSGDHEAFIAYNRAFHTALAKASGNRRMAAALCDLIEQADRLVRVSIANLRGHNPTKLVAEHAALIDAMQRRDRRTAVRIIKDHISQTEKRVLPALKRNAVIVDKE